MKILTIVFSLSKGGTERAAQTFAKAYFEIGHDSRLLTFYNLGPRYEEIKDKIKIYHKPCNKNLKDIKKWDPDIIHIHSHGLKKEDVNLVLNHLNSYKLKVIEQNVFSMPSPWFRKIDISFQLSQWALWLYNIRGGFKHNTAIIPYPFKCSNFKPQSKEKIYDFRKKNNIPQKAFLIGRIGQAYIGKWSEMMINSFNLLNNRYDNIFLCLVNPPPNIINKVNKSKFKEKIVIIPKILGDENLAIAYSSFNIMLHIAEQGESFGYVLTESMSCGTPVITLSTPWGDNSQCEVVNNLRSGYVVNSQQGVINALKDYIRKSNQNIEKKKIMAIKQSQEFDYIKIATKVIDSIFVKKAIKYPQKKLLKLQKIHMIKQITYPYYY